jgi:coenzyme F420 hydrogenase subunit beta
VSNTFDEARQETQDVLKETTKRFAFKKLEREIVKKGVCIECGACVSNCPADALTAVHEDGRYIPTLTGKCIACGICYAGCPRTFHDRHLLLGDFISGWKAKAVSKVPKAQDGGVVTAINSAALASGLIETAVVVRGSEAEPWKPEIVLAKTDDELANAAGSIYTHAQIVEGVTRAAKEGIKKLSVTGTACNIDAVWRMDAFRPGILTRMKGAEVLKIGLFCTKSYTYNELVDFLKKNGVDIAKVTRFAISGGKLIVDTPDGEKEWPVAELEHFSAPGCNFCLDMSSFHADLSCGNQGSDEGWTTVLVRTPQGEKALKAAIKAKLIEVKKLEEKDLRVVDNLARFKMSRKYKTK